MQKEAEERLEEPSQLEATQKEIKKVVERDYIKDGDDSLISFFAVPKGEETIRMGPWS